jgi:hypothetical protein
MTQPCRPTATVRFMHMSEHSSKQLMSRMAPLTTRERFYPQPFAMEPGETFFSWKGAGELSLYSLQAMKKWILFFRLRAAWGKVVIKTLGVLTNFGGFIPSPQGPGLLPRIDKAESVGTVGVVARAAYRHLYRERTEMDAIIGKYRARIEETGLILTHPTRISFDLTLDEAKGLMELIKVYQDARAAAQHELDNITLSLKRSRGG